MPKENHLTTALGPIVLKRKIIVFSYHKCGTVLFRSIFHPLCSCLGFSFSVVYGLATKDSFSSDITLLEHSQFKDDDLPTEYTGIHLSRDPRDILVSGYFYHKRCSEDWAHSVISDANSELSYPEIPYVLESRDVKIHQIYANTLSGTSYQEKLNSMDYDDGLSFEYEHYTCWTLQDLSKWRARPNVFECRMEVMYEDYDSWVQKICDFIDEGRLFRWMFLRFAAKQNILTKTDAQLGVNNHISSRQISKWRGVLSSNMCNRFYSDWSGMFDSSGECTLPIGRQHE